jgi:FixJ family two-component response regulator
MSASTPIPSPLPKEDMPIAGIRRRAGKASRGTSSDDPLFEGQPTGAVPKPRIKNPKRIVMRVIVVDVDQDFRDELCTLLTDHGHRAVGVPTAARAIEALERDEFDVMFSDVEVSHERGFELLRVVGRRWPRLLVVMLAGSATVETAVKAMQLGAFDYLRKPVQASRVHRILELVSQQLALTQTGGEERDPVSYATALAAEGGYEVLLIAPPPVHVTEPRVSHIPLDPENPFGIQEAVEEFVKPKERAAVVLAAVEELLARHREEDVAALLERIREVLTGKGPLAVTFDPSKITATGAVTVRSSIVAAEANMTIESIASPIRRSVLRRLAAGDCTFTQTLEAAHLNDTSLIAFHLRKLSESGLIERLPGKRYRLSSRGQGAVRVLETIDRLDPKRGRGNQVFAWKPPKGGPKGSPKGRTRP